MAQDMIFDRVELAEPHEYSWLAAPYHANIHTEDHPATQKHGAINSQPSGRSISIFFDHVFLSHKSGRMGVFIRNFLVRPKVFRSLFFCPIRATLIMGTKKLYKNGPNPFFLFGTKNLVRVKLMAMVLFRHGFDN